MKLKHPDSTADFNAEPSFFLRSFDVYDQEETLGEELNRYDPNDPKQLAHVLREQFFDTKLAGKLTDAHKTELLRALKRALDEGYDFAALVGSPSSIDEYFTLPANWKIRNPRAFFEEIYKQACTIWQMRGDHKAV